MFICNISVVFGDSSSSMTPGKGSYTPSGGDNRDCVWDKNTKEQFLRVSLFMAPREEGIDAEDSKAKAYSIDWSSDEVTQVGKTFDWTSENPSAAIQYHTDFTNAKQYYEDEYQKRVTKWKLYSGQKRTFKLDVDLAGLKFPRPVGNDNDQSVKEYFNSDDVMNEVLWLLKETVGATKGGDGTEINGIWTEWLNEGYWINKDGEKEPVAYLLIVEPGVYARVNKEMSAYTLRDALAWHKSKNDKSVPNVNPLSYNPESCVYLAKAVTLEENTNYGSIGLYRGNESNDTTGDEVKALRKESSGIGTKLSQFMGVGTTVYWGNGEPIDNSVIPPVIEYYYDLANEEPTTQNLEYTITYTDGTTKTEEKEVKTQLKYFDTPTAVAENNTKKPNLDAKITKDGYTLTDVMFLNTTSNPNDYLDNKVTSSRNLLNYVQPLNGHLELRNGEVKFISNDVTTDVSGNEVAANEGEYWLTYNASSALMQNCRIGTFNE